MRLRRDIHVTIESLNVKGKLKVKIRSRRTGIVVLLAGIMMTSNTLAHNISTVAGNGNFGNSGDAGYASVAALNDPKDVAVDSAGNIYTADVAGVRKISPAGIISTFAAIPNSQDVAVDKHGNVYVASIYTVYKVNPNGLVSTFAGGHYGFSGDGGPAVDAALSFAVRGVAVDSADNVYIADTDNNRIRKVTPDGVINTIAGNGVASYSGDGGLAINASIRAPYDVAVDASGNIYIADTVNNRMRVVSSAGIISSRVFDSRGVWFVAIGRGGDLYYGGYSSHLVTKVDANGLVDIAGTGVPGFSGDGGAALGANLYRPMGAAIDSAGNLYIADSQNSRVRKVVLNQQTTKRADFDGDGLSDIFWRNIGTGANTIWRSADYTIPQSVVGMANLDWKVVGMGDFDGDGRSDVVWRNALTGANTIWQSANAGTVRWVAKLTDRAWAVAGIGDFNGDGKSDLLWRNGATGANMIWKSGANSSRQTVAPVTDLAWDISGVGDFYGDGRADILWRNRVTGANMIWMAGNPATQQIIQAESNLAWQVTGVADFDGDGRSDILWRYRSNGANRIWRSADKATPLGVNAISDQNWKVAALGDYDGDGRSDILWRHATTGKNTMWRSGMQSRAKPVRSIADLAWTIAK